MVRVTRVLLGGGRHYHYPKSVWTPAGGWWNKAPEGWQVNTAIAGAALVMTASFVFKLSAENERRPVPPLRAAPSQRWCTHAKEDDPRLA